jgi:hypothetical protein
MEAATGRLRLDLRGRVVLTEGATGAYAVTPVLAALAGARVFALANATRHAPAKAIAEATLGLARIAGVEDQIELVRETSSELLARIDIVTNSGQVRPIDNAMVTCLRPSCVVPLMYEAWEFRSADLDLDACRSRGIAVAGTNERHPAVDVFSFLGPLAVRELQDAGVAVYGSRVVVLCDNDFAPFIAAGLRHSGARVRQAPTLDARWLGEPCDAVLVALQPRDAPVLTAADAEQLARLAPGTAVIQYWGDIDRDALERLDVPIWPPREPDAGHMAVLLSALGPEPIVRLQAGGLKVAEVLSSGLHAAAAVDLELIQLM